MGQRETMDSNAIREKFGDDYLADARTYTMGIDQRFTAHFAERFAGRKVLETCTGAGFTTISLARTAKHVYTVEIDPKIQAQAKTNIVRAGLSDRVTFIHGDILDDDLSNNLPPADSAFLDPDWAVTGPDHVYRFTNSNTQPPADTLLHRIRDVTTNITLVLPPLVEISELHGLPAHEREELYLNGSHELYCLYFGELAGSLGETEFHIGT
jgi:SAM-dependent methyltransferase